VVCVESWEAEELQDSVRDGEPVGCEVFVEDFAGLDSR
jgi:hypothetical protein